MPKWPDQGPTGLIVGAHLAHLGTVGSRGRAGGVGAIGRSEPPNLPLLCKESMAGGWLQGLDMGRISEQGLNDRVLARRSSKHPSDSHCNLRRYPFQLWALLRAAHLGPAKTKMGDYLQDFCLKFIVVMWEEGRLRTAPQPRISRVLL